MCSINNLLSVEDETASVDVYKLSTVRMKLEEKRRQIEQEKRKAEVDMHRQQQKVGKAAFLQTINKVSVKLNFFLISKKTLHVPMLKPTENCLNIFNMIDEKSNLKSILCPVIWLIRKKNPTKFVIKMR